MPSHVSRALRAAARERANEEEIGVGADRNHEAHVWTFRDGKVARFQIYRTPQQRRLPTAWSSLLDLEERGGTRAAALDAHREFILRVVGVAIQRLQAKIARTIVRRCPTCGFRTRSILNYLRAACNFDVWWGRWTRINEDDEASAA